MISVVVGIHYYTVADLGFYKGGFYYHTVKNFGGENTLANHSNSPTFLPIFYLQVQ